VKDRNLPEGAAKPHSIISYPGMAGAGQRRPGGPGISFTCGEAAWRP